MKLCGHCHRALEEGSDWRCPFCHWQAAVLNGWPAFAPELAQGGAGFHVEGFEELAGAEQGSFWFRSRNQLILWALRTYFPSAQSFFEVGCGTGFVLSAVAAANPGMRLAGSEIFAEGLRFAAQRLPGVELMQMDARTIPFVDEFDVIGAFDVLEHIAEDEVVLGEMFRALKPGGGLLVTVPQHMFLWSATDEQACHARRYSAPELRAKVGRAGFEVLRQTSFVSLLLPAMLLTRRKKKIRRESIASCELQLPKLLNSMLGQIMRCEHFLIRQGASLPCGGSLLLVAGKP